MKLETVFIDIELEGRKKKPIDYVFVHLVKSGVKLKKIVLDGSLVFKCLEGETFYITTLFYTHLFYKGVALGVGRKKVF